MESGGGRENGKGKRAAPGGRAGGLDGWEERGGGRVGRDHVPPEQPAGSERELDDLGGGEGEAGKGRPGLKLVCSCCRSCPRSLCSRVEAELKYILLCRVRPFFPGIRFALCWLYRKWALHLGSVRVGTRLSLSTPPPPPPAPSQAPFPDWGFPLCEGRASGFGPARVTRIRQRSGKRGQWVEKGKDVFDKSDSSPDQVLATAHLPDMWFTCLLLASASGPCLQSGMGALATSGLISWNHL
ncbi:uncharacterized protein LOC120238291 [Hyaena hyaena]|uniref:uncharacterized protein LOC120238291 n=1 Tax=Hyaena hyaena TaxID=95912 RepID=UPI0019212AF8|nr:uncharacterized protein LOC120238291 [Hyaena hyaena]